MDNGEERPRRPPNAFILFSMKNRNSVKKFYPRTENRKITKILGGWWRNLESKEKVFYTDSAEKFKKEFLEANPDFNWSDPQSASSLQRKAKHGKKKQANAGSSAVNSSITSGQLADDSQLGGWSSSLSNSTAGSSPNKLHHQLTPANDITYFKTMQELQELGVFGEKNHSDFDSITICDSQKEKTKLKLTNEDGHEFITYAKTITIKKTVCFIEKGDVGGSNVIEMRDPLLSFSSLLGDEFQNLASDSTEIEENDYETEDAGQNLTESELFKLGSPEDIFMLFETAQQIDSELIRKLSEEAPFSDFQIIKESQSNYEKEYERRLNNGSHSSESRREKHVKRKSYSKTENRKHSDKMRKCHDRTSDCGRRKHTVGVSGESEVPLSQLQKLIQQLPSQCFEEYQRKKIEKRKKNMFTTPAIYDHL